MRVLACPQARRRGYTQTPVPATEGDKGQTNGGYIHWSMGLGNADTTVSFGPNLDSSRS